MDRPAVRRWTIATPDPVAAAELAQRLRTSPLLAQVLLNRGLREAEECLSFLRPNLKCLHDPFLLPNLEKAAERVARAVREKEKIVVYGDYDVDGITATAILWHAIKCLGGVVEFYIPHRIEEGYGLNAEAVAQLCEQGAKLIITVDCGVTAVDEVKVARERGVDVIVTDHHEWREGSGFRVQGSEQGSGFGVQGSGEDGTASSSLNPAPRTRNTKRKPQLTRSDTIVHPRLPHDAPPYPNPALCGAGVAFKLAWGVGKVMTGANRVSDEFRAFLINAMALAALGTIADVVPLVGENRILAHQGLVGLRESKLVGLRALIASAKLTGQALDSFDVGFKLAPRLNACGRMGHARLAVEMLTTEDERKAGEIATYLEQQNRARQAIERKILQQAIEQVTERKLDADGSCAIVLGREEWHPGVIGIVASRLVDRYHRPAVMVALSNGHGQGSGRSIAGFHLSRALEACAQHLEGFGGHEMAAGLTLQTSKFEDFRAHFCQHAGSVIQPEMLVPELRLDAVAELSQLSEALVQDLKRIGPFGHGNPRPLLCCKGLEVVAAPRRVGPSGDHLQILVRQDPGARPIKCIAFGYGPLFDRLTPGTKIDLAVEAQINEYQGYRNVELQVKDLQFPG
jgi:single-stranded-DNA-specific exonuclease